MSFWESELGQLSGKPEDAFTKSIRVIPDNTKAIAKIVDFSLVEKKEKNYYEIDWEITQGEFKGWHVFHKIHAFDSDHKKRHRALNMLMLIYNMFGIKPKNSAPPTDDDLRAFFGKHAGLKIQEWSMPKTDGSGMMEGNHISEVHPAQNFVCETGQKMEVVHQTNHLETAFSRNPVNAVNLPDDEIPF